MLSCIVLVATSNGLVYDPPPLPSNIVVKQVQFLPATQANMYCLLATNKDDSIWLFTGTKIGNNLTTPAPTMKQSKPAFTQPVAGTGGIVAPAIPGNSARPAGFLPPDCGNAAPFPKAILCPGQASTEVSSTVQ